MNAFCVFKNLLYLLYFLENYILDHYLKGSDIFLFFQFTAIFAEIDFILYYSLRIESLLSVRCGCSWEVWGGREPGIAESDSSLFSIVSQKSLIYDELQISLNALHRKTNAFIALITVTWRQSFYSVWYQPNTMPLTLPRTWFTRLALYTLTFLPIFRLCSNYTG